MIGTLRIGVALYAGILLLPVTCPAPAQAQSVCSVTTFAGSSTPGFSDGTGTAARFKSPASISQDESGNLYIADAGNNAIRTMTAAGAVTTIAGQTAAGYVNGIGTAAKFNNPFFAGSTGTAIFVMDSGNNAVREIVWPGSAQVTTAAGGSGSGFVDGAGTIAKFNDPTGANKDGLGNYVLVDHGNNAIRKATTSFVVSTFAGQSAAGLLDGTGTSAKFSGPTAVTRDSNNNLYVTDTNNNAIRMITPSGVVTTLAGGGSAGFADGVGAAAQFNHPTGIDIDDGPPVYLYVADTGNNAVRAVALDGTVTTLVGSSGTAGYVDGTAATTRFNQPNGVSITSSGNFYVSDTNNNVIRSATNCPPVSTSTPQTGWYWNSSEGGRGYSLEVSPTDGSMFFAAYMYDTTGAPVWYAGTLTSSTAGTYNGSLLEYQGGQTLNGSYKAATSSTIASITLTFQSQTTATMSITGTGLNPTNETIQRYEFVTNGLSNGPTSSEPQTGWWWNSAEGGRGYFLEIQANTMFMAAYMYDTNAKPIWYSAQNALTTNTSFSDALSQYGNGQTLGGAFKPASVTNSNVGTLSIQISSPTQGVMTLPDGVQIPIQRYTF